MDSLNQTLALFFGNDDEPTEKACTDCGATDNLKVLYTKENGNTVWVCTGCQAKRQAAQAASEKREADRIASWAAMDAWEEG